MTHQLTAMLAPEYVDKRRSYRNDFETRVVAGPVVFTANAGGSTTTIVGANAAPGAGTNVVRIGDEFKLFTAAGVLKEETVFTVTAIAVAASTTVTFSPAAAAATISTDTMKLVGNYNQNSSAEMDRRLAVLGFTTARINTMTENDKQYQLRVSDDPGSI
ncbi:MAG: hypothetical protein HMLIMOIP_002093 [Candidatus Nitrosomirales archaeon]|jgi:hypothetical protein